MPRGPRLDAPGVLHHVMVRGMDRQVIFRDDRDRDDFTGRLKRLAEKKSIVVYAWALLPNHVHLLIRTGASPLARSMRSLLTGYAGVFNRRHGRSGHLFQNRYKSIVVEEERYLLELVRYLHLNPLRANVVPSIRALAGYPYCGHGALVGRQEVPWQAVGEVLAHFSGRLRRARDQYQSFVAEGVALGHRPELLGGGLIRSAGGWAAVSSLRRGRESYAADERILGGSDFVEAVRKEVELAEARRVRARMRDITTAELIGRVAKAVGIPLDRLLGPGRPRAVTRAREGIAYLWIEEMGRSGRVIARDLSLRPESVYRAAVRGRQEAVHWQDVLKM